MQRARYYHNYEEVERVLGALIRLEIHQRGDDGECWDDEELGPEWTCLQVPSDIRRAITPIHNVFFDPNCGVYKFTRSGRIDCPGDGGSECS